MVIFLKMAMPMSGSNCFQEYMILKISYKTRLGEGLLNFL